MVVIPPEGGSLGKLGRKSGSGCGATPASRFRRLRIVGQSLVEAAAGASLEPAPLSLLGVSDFAVSEDSLDALGGDVDDLARLSVT